ncbi:carboxypeptidase-like regulatory domain-containing protein [Allofustis seminis]|uniref:carboxypeptidase-like regulatory domain-containing protein n=1 Tax=Allofustis seminis TaxID=166939 RepID=UPI0003632404|nr:carboxypeptidase-like regulatory domain-containing protein [Allofustis seminis]
METKEDTVAAEVAENEATEEKAEEQATEKEDKKESAVLEMAEENIPTKLGDPAPAEAQKTTFNVKFAWRYTDDSEKPFYNPADTGKKVDFYFYVSGITGTDVKTGKKVDYMTGWIKRTFTIGTDEIIPLRLDRDHLGNQYKDIDAHAASVTLGTGIFKDEQGEVFNRNTRYYASKGGGPSGPNPYDFRIPISQAMELGVLFNQTNDLKVPAEHEGKINIRFNVKDKETDKLVKGGNGKVIEDVLTFESGADTALIDNNNYETGFARALRSGRLDLFSAYTGKYKDYQVIAEFTGENKQELEKYYTIVVDGNDLDGWVVTLAPKAAYRVTFTDKEGHELLPPKDVQYAETVGTVQAPTAPAGYVFDAWYEQTGVDQAGQPILATTPFDAATKIIKDTQLVAQFMKLRSATATVIDQDGAGLKGQTVEVYDADGAHVGTITTDERGLGFVHDLRPGKDYTFKLMFGGRVKEEQTVTITENYISGVTFRLHSEPMKPLVPAEEKETDNETDNETGNEKDEGKVEENSNGENEEGDTKKGKEKEDKNKLPKAGEAVGLGAAVAYLFSGIGLYGVTRRKEEQ